MRHHLLCVAACLTLAPPAQAQDWPQRPVTMVVPFSAGGPVDVLARIIQQPLTEALGQNVIVDNVTGGGGSTGSLRVSNAASDSHMFVLGSIGTHSINQSMSKKPPYDAATDFTPVALVADAPLVLIVKADLPVNNLKEFIAYARANPDKITYGSGGAGTSSHIGCVLLNQTIGAPSIVHVPYRGGGPAMQDLMAGRLDYICNYVSTAITAVKAGKAKVIAALSTQRVPAFPDVPTADEQGLKDFDISAWNAAFLPKTATPVQVKALNAALSKAIDTPMVRKRFEDTGLDAPSAERRTPEYLGRFVASEIVKWQAPVKASGVSND